jgi:hypothetical protein
VWAKQNGTSGQAIAWRWQLVRLLDGRADSGDGEQLLGDSVRGEIYAIEQGLADLRRRIERGGHAPSRYGVEIRCSTATAAQLSGLPPSAASAAVPVLPAGWEVEKAHWKALTFAPVRS